METSGNASGEYSFLSALLERSFEEKSKIRAETCFCPNTYHSACSLNTNKSTSQQINHTAMQPFQCYIIDDEPLAVKVIEQHLAKFDGFEVCGASTDPVAAYTQVKQLQPDLLFLDIEMPGINGLELLASMQNKPEVVITTAYREYAVEGFAMNVLDYLVKPIPFTRFMQAIDKFLERRRPAPLSSLAGAPPTDAIFVKADRKAVKVELEDILYVEGMKDYVKIVLSDQHILTKGSIGNFLQQLPADRFVRVHKSFVVAKNKITAYTRHDVEIGEIEIPIGRGFKKDFLRGI